MRGRGLLGGIILSAALCVTLGGAEAFDDAKYPDWGGQWMRIGDARWDVSKPVGLGQEAPLTPEYQAKFESSLADQTAGGQGLNLMSKCYPPGMPRMTLGYNQFEFLIFPDMTYIVQEHFGELRRVYTDNRLWPQNIKSTFAGYSIGRWIDEDGDGRYDALRVETRNIGGPRTFDHTGLPLHEDGQTIVKEYIRVDPGNPDILRNEITTIDHALTRPWVVTKDYRRTKTNKPIWWKETVCAENNVHVAIGKEIYFLSGDGFLMPAMKDQPPPDLRYFDKSRK
jgi:hypothetical protein